MTDLHRLRVSLTKHGAHKIAFLLAKYPADAVLQHTDDPVLDVHIDRAQAASNMSAIDQGAVPAYWAEAKTAGDLARRGLVLLAIVHSHYQLIRAMRASRPRCGVGVVRRGAGISGKEYTNFACIFRDLDFIHEEANEYFVYDFCSLLSNDAMPALVSAMLQDKLRSAGMASDADVIKECIELGLNDVIGLTADEYTAWLRGEDWASLPSTVDPIPDSEELDSSAELQFVPGHVPRPTIPLSVAGSVDAHPVELLHNEIQNSLVGYLACAHGGEKVGSEQSLALGCRVDAVIRVGQGYVFYEIKTSNNARSAIRQALAQLMEYAYWPDAVRAEKLVVVAPGKATHRAAQYLAHLRNDFSLPVHYMQYCRKHGTFGPEI